jgi:methylated-DNA-[protein]-cysteine S-methyltransferase
MRQNTNKPFFCMVLPSPFGPFGILWRQSGYQAIIQQVFLPSPMAAVEERIHAAFGDAQRGSHATIRALGERMQAFLDGEPVTFALDSVALHNCSEFQQRVLVAEHGIPRGWVSTYGLIAAHLAAERGARAVGTALARNPFPLIIPCHRAIRSDGELGGYQGGLAMKRRLLEMEGVEVSETGIVVRPRLHYAPRRGCGRPILSECSTGRDGLPVT